MKPTIHNIVNFYNELSPHYHLLSENWDISIENDAKIIMSLLPSLEEHRPVLDCSCGIGTQLIALKQAGYNIEGSDLSKEEVARAIQEAQKRDLTIDIRVDVMRTLHTAPKDHYGVILSIGNSLPHLLSDDEILESLIAMKNALDSNGFIMIGLKNYEVILSKQIKTSEPRFFNDEYGKRIIHQIWDWHDERVHTVHLYITQEINNIWEVKHFVCTYRAVTLKEIELLMLKAGLTNISILYPEETNFCQPIVKAYK